MTLSGNEVEYLAEELWKANRTEGSKRSWLDLDPDVRTYWRDRACKVLKQL